MNTGRESFLLEDLGPIARTPAKFPTEWKFEWLILLRNRPNIEWVYFDLYVGFMFLERFIKLAS